MNLHIFCQRPLHWYTIWANLVVPLKWMSAAVCLNAAWQWIHTRQKTSVAQKCYWSIHPFNPPRSLTSFTVLRTNCQLHISWGAETTVANCLYMALNYSISSPICMLPNVTLNNDWSFLKLLESTKPYLWLSIECDRKDLLNTNRR